MPTRVNRTEFLQQLRAVEAGLSKTEFVEQSSCFGFKDGMVMTFNDEMACQTKSLLDKSFVGVVKAAPLMKILDKMPDDVVEVTPGESELIVAGKRKKTGVTMEKDFNLPIHTVEKPDEWKELPSNFKDAVEMVQECAGKDESQFTTTCLHLHPKWIEASDRFQLTRYRIRMGISTPCLVRRDSIVRVIPLDVTEFAETEKWIHFRNPAKLVLSCCRYVEPFRDLKPYLSIDGTEPATLPRTLGEAAERAEIFSSENQDENLVEVDLKPGKLVIRGQGASGWYAESKSLKYDGQPMTFMVKPKVLVQLVKKHTDCFVSQDRLIVKAAKFTYVTCLGVEEESHAVTASETE